MSVKWWLTLGDPGTHDPLGGRRHLAGPRGDNPSRLQLQERKIGALGEKLADDAEVRQVRMQSSLVERKAATDRAPQLGTEIRDVKVISGGADDGFDRFGRTIGEDDVAAVDLGDSRAARNRLIANLGEVVLAQRKAGCPNIRIRLRRAEINWVA